MLGQIVNKMRKSFQRRGILGTARYAAGRVFGPLLEVTPSRQRKRRLKDEKDRAFDTRYGVDTAGIIELKQLHIPGTSWEYGVPYWAVDPDVYARLLGELTIRHEDFTFVDFGSGKGRAVLLASEFPFKKVIGVELSAELHRIARQNVRSFRSEQQRCRNIELVCTDALEYELPGGPGVYFFYNPFSKEIMERVGERIERSYRERPRDIYVLYVNPKEADAWERAASFRKVAGSGDYVIYKAGA